MLRKTLVQHAKQLSRPSLLNRDRQELLRNLTLTRFNHSPTMQERIQFSPDFFFRQLFEEVSSTYTYLLADVASKEAILIDPGTYKKIW